MHESHPAGPRSSTAHLAIAIALLAFALTLFCVIAYAVFAAEAAAEDAAASLEGKLNQEQMLNNAARIASATKTQRAALSAFPLPLNGGAAFIANIESLGRTANAAATVSSVTATAPQGAQPGVLSLSAHFSGSFIACMRFLQLVETMPASVAISTTALNYDAISGAWSGTLSLSALSFDTP